MRRHLKIEVVPKVATKGLTLSRVTINPFVVPAINPTVMASRAASGSAITFASMAWHTVAPAA